jgi:hypothetical protein
MIVCQGFSATNIPELDLWCGVSNTSVGENGKPLRGSDLAFTDVVHINSPQALK